MPLRYSLEALTISVIPRLTASTNFCREVFRKRYLGIPITPDVRYIPLAVNV